MVTAAYLVYALAQLALLVMVVRLLLRDRHWTYAVLTVNVAGLVYDNLILGFGAQIGAGATLMALNYPRFVIHALTTPLLGMIGLYLARNAAVEWAWGRRALISFWALSLAALAWSAYTDLALLRLELVSEGALRYRNAGVSGPPLPAITAMVLLMFAGMGVIIRTRSAWLFTGALVMFSAAAFAASIGLVANLGEIVLVAGLVVTGMRFQRLGQEEFARRQRVLTRAERERLAEEQRGRKRRLAVANRWMAWVMAPVLLVGTLAYYRDAIGLGGILNEAIDQGFNNLFIMLFFVHATASFYFYGVPRPRMSIRVFHVYIGYAVFLFTMVSQSLLGVEPIHIITYVVNWVFIVAHLALSLRFMVKRVTRQRQDPMLEIAISKKYAAPASGD